MSRRKRHLCSLCGMKLPREKTEYVTGLTGHSVCKHCVATASKIHTAHQPSLVSKAALTNDVPSGILTPQQIINALNNSIIGQEEAKRAIALALWKQQLRAQGDKSVPRGPLLLYGPTGCGKTALVREAAKLVDLPCITFDATSLSETGYRGRDAQDMVKDLCEMCAGHKNLAYGIIMLDEVDKLAARSSPERAAYSRATQHSLLKLVEGTVITTSLGITMDSSDLQFVFGGAFTGLEELIRHRTRPTRSIGFRQEAAEATPDLTPITEDFIRYGMEPELLGRITRKVRLAPLSRDDLRRILLDSEISILKRYREFFQRKGVLLQLSEGQIDQWLDRASAMGTGARGLQTVVEEAMEPLLLRLAEHNTERTVTWDAG